MASPQTTDPYTQWLDDAVQMESEFDSGMRPALVLSAAFGVLAALAVFL